MKKVNRNRLFVAGLCVIALSFATAAYAEKGAERLLNAPKASINAPAQITTMAAHRCPSCTDTLVSVVDKGTKGPNHAVSKVVRHNCSSCDTKIVTEGTGKAKHDVAIHSCNGEVKPLCCARN